MANAFAEEKSRQKNFFLFEKKDGKNQNIVRVYVSNLTAQHKTKHYYYILSSLVSHYPLTYKNTNLYTYLLYEEKKI